MTFINSLLEPMKFVHAEVFLPHKDLVLGRDVGVEEERHCEGGAAQEAGGQGQEQRHAGAAGGGHGHSHFQYRVNYEHLLYDFT